MSLVAVAKCETYEESDVRRALGEALDAIGGLDWVKSGMTIAIKCNLVSMMKPSQAATTHPALVTELCRMLTERGATPIIGDSPGGLYNSAVLSGIYNATGMHEAEAVGAKLNRNFGSSSGSYPEGVKMHTFTYTSWLDDTDAIINFCKLKSHGMMGMSAAVKNMFGAIPGITKPEYHYRFPNAADFAEMLIDLNEYFKPQLCLVDAVEGMEGNGPTQGDPRHIGAVLASRTPYDLDLVCAKLIGIDRSGVPTLEAAARRGLSEENAEKVSVIGDVEGLMICDFKCTQASSNIEFAPKKGGVFGRLVGKVEEVCLCSKPKVKAKECIGCKKCFDICPAKAITMKNKVPDIDRSKCIRCFCCQEFCPKGAMKVHRPWIAKALNGKVKK